MIHPWFAAALAASLLAAHALAEEPEGPRARAELISEADGIAPGGSVRIAIDFTIDPGWHLYWKGRNDTGFEPQVRWDLPEGWSVSDLRWPAPRRYVTAGQILDHVYEDRVTLVADLHAPADARGEATIAADLSWLVCSDVCIPEDAQVSLRLPVSASARPAPGAGAIAAAAQRWPSIAEPGVIEHLWAGRTLRLSVAGAERLAFFPDADAPAMADPIADLESRGEALTVRCTDELGPVRRVGGVLEVVRGGNTTWHIIDLPGPDAPPPGSGRRH